MSGYVKFCLVVGLLGVGATQNFEDYRLPTNVDSIRYRVTIVPDLSTSTFSASMIFDFNFLGSGSSQLVMNAKNLAFDRKDLIITHNYQDVPLKEVNNDSSLERLVIRPMQPFRPTDIYTLRLNYTGFINDDGVGLYSMTYTDGSGRAEVGMASQLRPVHARRVFPCLDEPAFRAHFVIAVVHDAAIKPISNMPIATSNQIPNGQVLTIFEETPPIPAFLIGLLLTKFPSIQGVEGFASYATPYNVRGVAFSADISPFIALAGEKVTGITYPLNKTDLVALPKLVPVAMENWGLHTFKEGNILYFENESPTVQRQTSARFSAHEILHAWMGNMVSLGWWDYLWMSEAFAMYYEYLLPHMVEPFWRMNEQMVIDLQQAGLLADSQPTDPLTTRVLTPQQISNKFSGITYTKGPGILRMAIHILGEDTFLLGFHKLLDHLKYNSIPNPETLWGWLESSGTNLPAPLSTIMSDWTTTNGYPVVNVMITDDHITVAQNEFSLVEKARSTKSWWIPLTMTRESECNFKNTSPKLWIPKGQKVLTIPNANQDKGWILFNVLSAGFYRVNYDVENWNKLIRQLITDHTKIPPLNRAQLIDDSLNLARAGKLSYMTTLSLCSYLTKEFDFIPWRSAISGFNELDRLLLNTPIYQDFRGFVASLVGPVFDVIGWEEKVGDSHVDKVQREEITRLACSFGYSNCVEKATVYVSQILSSLNPTISVDVRETALCTGTANGNQETWSAFVALYQRSTDPRQKASHLLAMSCPANPKLTSSYLLTSLSKISAAEWNTIYAAFASQKQNSGELIQLMTNYKTEIENLIGRDAYMSNLLLITQNLNSDKEDKLLEDLQRFGIGNVGLTRKTIRNKIAWAAKHYSLFYAFFKKDLHQTLVFS